MSGFRNAECKTLGKTGRLFHSESLGFLSREKEKGGMEREEVNKTKRDRETERDRDRQRQRQRQRQTDRQTETDG